MWFSIDLLSAELDDIVHHYDFLVVQEAVAFERINITIFWKIFLSEKFLTMKQDSSFSYKKLKKKNSKKWQKFL